MNPPIATTLLFGYLLGMEHALEADHVVAVSTMVSQTRSLLRALAGSAALMLLVLTTVQTPARDVLPSGLRIGIHCRDAADEQPGGPPLCPDRRSISADQ